MSSNLLHRWANKKALYLGLHGSSPNGHQYMEFVFIIILHTSPLIHVEKPNLEAATNVSACWI